MNEIHKKSNFLLFLKLFHPFWRNLDATGRFNFVIFANFGVSMVESWKNPWSFFDPRLQHLWGGVLFFSHYGGEIEFQTFLPPHISRPRGGKSSFCPLIFWDPGGAIILFPPHNGGGQKPAAGGKFSGFDPLKCQISFTKMYLDISNPKNFPPAAGYFHTWFALQ